MLDSFRTHASTTGPQWEASFQRIISKAEGKASGPQQRPMPKFTRHLTRVQETVPQQLHWPLWLQKANPHPSQRENHPQSPPNSACYSRSHSIKAQLTELRRPGCGRGEAAGLSQKAGWLGGGISAHGGYRQGDQSEGLRWRCATQRKEFPHTEIPLSPMPSSAAT